MLVNGKNYKYSRVIDFSGIFEYDDVYFYNIEIIDNDLYLYAQYLWYPKMVLDNMHEVFDCIDDCLLVVKNFKIVSEYFEPNLKNIKNKLFYFFNSKRKKELQINNGKMNYSFFGHFFDVLERVGGAQIMSYNASKKEILFQDGCSLRLDNKEISGSANLSLKCDEFIYYWNGFHSYLSGEKQHIKYYSCKTNKEENKMWLIDEAKKNYLELVRTITNFDNYIVDKFRECLNNPQEYYKKNYYNYKKRGLIEYTKDEDIYFLTLLDLLVENEYCCELDYKIDMSSFMSELRSLKNSFSFDENNLDNEHDLSIWCHFINEQWKNKNVCIVDIFTNSDSYAIFICDTKNVNYLSLLGKKINHPISKICYTNAKLKEAIIDLSEKNAKKISKYLDKDDLDGKTRDKLKDEVFWTNYIQVIKSRISDKVKYILEIKKNLSDAEIKKLELNKSSLRYQKYELIVAMYSAGYDIDICRQAYQEFLKCAIEDVLIAWVGWQKITEYIALGVLLNGDNEMIDYLKQIIKLSGCNNELITFFMSYLDNSYSCEVPETKLSKCYCYKSFENIVNGKCNKIDSINIIVNYLEKEWTKTIEGLEECAYGCWTFEIGAIVKILKIEDESFKKFRYYPYDLVHYNIEKSTNN